MNGCAVDASGERIASVSDKGEVKVWDARMGACLATLYVDGSLATCAFYPDGKQLVVAGDAGLYFLKLLT